jgi:small subunit ribosomal protein S16
VKVLIKKYGPEGTHLEQQRLALARMAQGRHRVAPPPPPAAPAAEGEPADTEPETPPES